MYNQDYFIDLVKKQSEGVQTMAVAAPHDIGTILSVSKAVELGFVKAILVGVPEDIQNAAKEAGVSLDNMEIVEAEDLYDVADKTIGLIKDSRASMIMKGLIDTSILLKAVVKRENGLRTGRTLSHAGVVFKEGFDRMFVVSDVAMNIAPDIEAKKHIIENAVEFSHALGIEKPNVALLCAKEKAYDKMPATMDAQELRNMYERGEFKDCVVSGPLQIDNALSIESAKLKGVKDEVAGKADVLIFPTIEVGNVLIKGLTYLAGFTMAGIIVGAKVPIVLVSRSDGEKEKLISIALGCMAASKSN